MSVYEPLFQLTLAHEYSADVARCRMRLLPDERSAAWLERNGVALRSGPSGLVAVWDARGRTLESTLESALESTSENTLSNPLPVVLHFALQSEDPRFTSYTAGLAAPGWPVPRFDSDDAVPDATDAGPANGGPATMTLAQPSAGPPNLAAAAAPAPHFRVTLRLSRPAQAWRLQLASRALVWKYLVVGDWAVSLPSIVDLAGKVSFEPASDEALASGVPAMAIRSTTALPLRARADHRFQLRGRVDGRPGKLLERLPLASAGQLGLDRPRGSALVSEIFVQRPVRSTVQR